MEKKIEVVLDKWFDKHQTISRENYEMLKEMVDIFSIAQPEKKLEIVKCEKPVEKISRKDRGKIIYTAGGHNIHENVFEEVKNNPDDIKKILQRWHPNVKRQTLESYIWAYKKYLETKDITVVETKKRKKRRKKRRYPYGGKLPENVYAFNKTYRTYIFKNEVSNVLSGLRMVRYGYKPTVKGIADEKDMARARVRAVLNTLIKEGKVYSLLKEHNQLEYYLKE